MLGAKRNLISVGLTWVKINVKIETRICIDILVRNISCLIVYLQDISLFLYSHSKLDLMISRSDGLRWLIVRGACIGEVGIAAAGTNDGSNNVGFSRMPVARFLRVPSPRSASTVIMKHTNDTKGLNMYKCFMKSWHWHSGSIKIWMNWVIRPLACAYKSGQSIKWSCPYCYYCPWIEY